MRNNSECGDEQIEIPLHCVVHRGTGCSVIGTLWPLPLGGRRGSKVADYRTFPYVCLVRRLDLKRSSSSSSSDCRSAHLCLLSLAILPKCTNIVLIAVVEFSLDCAVLARSGRGCQNYPFHFTIHSSTLLDPRP